MDNYNLGNMISRFMNYRPPKVQNGSVGNANINQPAQTPAPQQPTPAPNTPSTPSTSPQMGQMGGSDAAAYIKDLMKLPRNLNEFIYMLQKNLNQMQFNRMFEMANRQTLSQTQAQILAQLQGLSTSELQTILKSQLTNQLSSSLKTLQINANGMINLADIANLIQANGKDAVTKLILSMANAAKQGITDLSGMKDTARLINASIALASPENPQQTLKTLLLLYLPWLPLAEGTGFDIEIETGQSGEESDSILIVTISTINFGRVVATLILETSNSVHVNIECQEKFPKEELLARIEGDEKHYSMQSVVSFETKTTPLERAEGAQTKAKINMSQTNEINPYLLLMAHTIIRHTIVIDNNASGGVVSHVDEH